MATVDIEPQVTPVSTTVDDVLQVAVKLYYRTNEFNNQMEELQRENLRLRAEVRQLRMMLKKSEFGQKGLIRLYHGRDNPDASEEPVFKKPTNPVVKPTDRALSS
jgi:regulator of replication initiation timing